MEFDGQALHQMSEQLLSCDNLEPEGCVGYDERNVEIPSTLDVSLPFDENSADTMCTETSQGPADPGSSAQQPATVSPQALELAPQPTDGCPVTCAPEEPATLAVVEGAENQQKRSNGVTGSSNTKDVEPPAQPIESPAKSNPGCPTATHQAPGPTLGEHPEEPATTTTT
jgi:hypothetical protein